MKYMIAHNGNNIVHFSQLNSKQKFNSGQPKKEEFANFDSFVTRLEELGVDTADIEQQKEPEPTTDEKIEQVRKETKQRTENVVSTIANIIEQKDFQKQGIGKELADGIRNKAKGK